MTVKYGLCENQKSIPEDLLRKVLRRIYSQCVNGNTCQWRIIRNKELDQLYHRLDLMQEIKNKTTKMGRTFMKERSVIDKINKFEL